MAGAIGAMVRFFIDGAVKSRISNAFPIGTLFINVTGSFILGLLTGLASNHVIATQLKVVLGTGFCGGYTTFSTANFETIRLAQGRRRYLSLVNLIATIVLTMLAAVLGIEIA